MPHSENCSLMSSGEMANMKHALSALKYSYFTNDVILSAASDVNIVISAANRLIGEVVQSRRRPLLGPSPG